MPYLSSYVTYEEAAERVDAIRHATGRWPGIRHNPDGTFTPDWHPRSIAFIETANQ